jgi:outer membrane protein OmpA-like peptidoglycan-associated protein
MRFAAELLPLFAPSYKRSAALALPATGPLIAHERRIPMFKRVAMVLLLMLASASLSWADAKMPTSDIKGRKDHPLVGRFKGSLLVSASSREFDEVVLPLAPLKAVEDKRDRHNNTLFKPEQAQTIEGRRTRLVYINPAGTSPLEVIRNYELELKKKGGVVLYQCAREECGGAPDRSSSGGGGDMSLAMLLWPEENIKDEAFSNGNCAQTSRINDQRFMTVELNGGSTFVAVHTFLVNDDLYCKAFNDLTVAVVEIIESLRMEEKMVVVKAEEMADAIANQGSIALYGIFFAFNKADLQPESEATLVQMAKLMQADPQLKVLVVGHTDTVGGYQSNLDLSKRRAEAVVQALAATHGIARNRLQPVGVSFASPVASNATEEGRAKNRRVALVKLEEGTTP